MSLSILSFTDSINKSVKEQWRAANTERRSHHPEFWSVILLKRDLSAYWHKGRGDFRKQDTWWGHRRKAVSSRSRTGIEKTFLRKILELVKNSKKNFRAQTKFRNLLEQFWSWRKFRKPFRKILGLNKVLEKKLEKFQDPKNSEKINRWKLFWIK